jgi:hypothetical protein
MDLTQRRAGTLIGAALLVMLRIDGVGQHVTEVDPQHSCAVFDHSHSHNGSLKLPGPEAQRKLLG